MFDGVYGTLTFEKACSLNCDYGIVGDANGCSCLYLEAGSSNYPTKQDISGLTLKVADISAFDKMAPKSRYKILDAPYGYTGTFDLGNVAAPWDVEYTPTAAYLHYVRGAKVSIR